MTLSKEAADAVIPVDRQAAAELDTLYVGLVRDYHRRIFNYVFRIVGDSALAEVRRQVEEYFAGQRRAFELPVAARRGAPGSTSTTSVPLGSSFSAKAVRSVEPG